MAQPHRLEPGDYRDLVRRALAEDMAGGDVTTDAIFGPNDRARATFLAKAACTLAGIDVALEAFSQLDSGVDAVVRVRDGDECAAGATIADVSGTARALLTGERRVHHDSRHAKNDADAARAGEVCRSHGRRNQPSPVTQRWRDD